MNIFKNMMKKSDGPVAEPGKIYAPVAGTYIPLSQVPDAVFSQGIVGQGCGIEPEEGKVYAPVDGVIATVADTRHAIGIVTEQGGEFLIHIGLDTVEMNGKGFTPKVKVGSHVKMGQLLMEFDMAAIKSAGHPVTSVLVLSNSSQYPDFTIRTDSRYTSGEEIGSF